MTTRIIDNKPYVLCPWRKKFVRLTPEEYVRQNFLHLLVEEFCYPAERIGVEVALYNKRADAVVYDRELRPCMLMEFKAERVPISQKTLDQAVIYNRQLHVPYLILHNGQTTIIAHIQAQEISFRPSIPHFDELLSL